MTFLFTRLFSAVLVMLSVTLLVFVLIHLIPGDPVDVMLGESASSADRLALRTALGLDQPLLTQLYDFLQGIMTLQMGTSLHSGEAVATLIAERLPATLQLALLAFVLGVLPGTLLGISAAINHQRFWDKVLQFVAMSGLAIPNFLLGPLLVLLFAVLLAGLPVSGSGSLSHLVLPAMTLGLSMMAIIMRMTRSTVLEIMGEDFIRTARAKGQTPRKIMLKHILANAWLPLITVIGAQFGALLTGAVVTETVFDWPGLGSLLIESIHKRDYPVVQISVLLMSLIYVLVNTLTDLLYARIDPRVRLS